MKVNKVSYTNFRNIEKAEIVLHPGMNLLYGNNAEGKTNALEGIYLCAQGRSHRTARERDYIRYGQEFARVVLDYEDALRPRQLELRYMKNGRKFCRKNGVPLQKMSQFIGNFRAVIFCPEYLSVVRDGPSERRAFMDGALSQLDPHYLLALQRYQSALCQRNKLLASYHFDPKAFKETGELWAMQMAECGEILSFKRAEYMERVAKEVSLLFGEMTRGREKPQLLYKSPRKKEEYMELFSKMEEREIKYGASLVGIHKDEVEILLDDKPARMFASQGQQRSIAVAMKLAEGTVSSEMTGEYPVFLLDDVLSELDEGRKRFVLSGLANRQVIITCCDEKDAEKIPEGQVIKVEKGQYQTIKRG